MIFAYFGPETVLPLASVLATVLGVVMMFGRLSLRIMLSPLRWLARGRRGNTPGSAIRGPVAWRHGAHSQGREPAESPAREEG